MWCTIRDIRITSCTVFTKTSFGVHFVSGFFASLKRGIPWLIETGTQLYFMLVKLIHSLNLMRHFTQSLTLLIVIWNVFVVNWWLYQWQVERCCRCNVSFIVVYLDKLGMVLIVEKSSLGDGLSTFLTLIVRLLTTSNLLALGKKHTSLSLQQFNSIYNTLTVVTRISIWELKL